MFLYSHRIGDPFTFIMMLDIFGIHILYRLIVSIYYFLFSYILCIDKIMFLKVKNNFSSKYDV